MHARRVEGFEEFANDEDSMKYVYIHIIVNMSICTIYNMYILAYMYTYIHLDILYNSVYLLPHIAQCT